MASLYDAILVKGNLRPRLNKNFVSPDKVPKNVMDVLTVDNIVDENGMIVVDQKKPEANKPTEENEAELNSEGTDENKLARVDQSSSDTPEQTPQEQAAPPAPTDTPQAPVVVDDSANQNQTPEGGQNATSTSDQAGKDQSAPVAQAAPQQSQPAPQPAPAPAPKAEAPAEPARVATTNEPVEKFRSKVPQSQQGMGFPRKNGYTVDIFDLITPHTHVKLVGGVSVPLSAESFRTKGDLAIQKRLAELGIETIDFSRMEREAAMAGVADSNPDLMLDEDEDDDEDIQLG